MTVVGVGTDVVDVARVGELVRRGGTRFLERWFREHEIAYCTPDSDGSRTATLLAAKEAVVKALGGHGELRVPWHEVEVVSDVRGVLDVQLHGPVRATAASAGVSSWRISVTHTFGLAMAVAVATSEHQGMALTTSRGRESPA